MSRITVAEEVQAAPEVPTCQHHWLIETPRGAMSNGRCKRCGAEREFRNSADGYIWEDDSSRGYNAWRGVRSTPKAVDDDGVTAAPRFARGERALVL